MQSVDDAEVKKGVLRRRAIESGTIEPSAAAESRIKPFVEAVLYSVF
jgi:hypothetical protein